MRYSILIIDDSEEDRYLLKRFIKKTGLDTSIVEMVNGEKAMDFLTRYEEHRKEHPDIVPPLLVFLDVNMPIMDGWEFLNEFRGQRSSIAIQPVVVVMYSTSDLQRDIDRIKKYDFVNSYLVKGTFAPDELKKTIVDNIASATN